MKEYLKMSDVFKGELFIDGDCDDVIVDDLSLTFLESFSGSDAAKFALHAISNHDELVADVERFRNMVIRMQDCLYMAGEYPEKESNNPLRQWLFDAIDCTKQ
ncbi:hypothetical protein [Aeromonas phage 4_4512]|nr:hypothetical protein [Aeromonas phage 4_4512]